QAEGFGEEGFDPEAACPAPVPPSVAFALLPATLTAHVPAPGAWTVSPGNHTGGHSMLTQLRWSHHPIAVEDLEGPEGYGTLLAQYAHQDVPNRFEAKLKFDKPGTYHLRAYAQVRSDGLPDTDFWSPEVQVVVGPVPPTGKVVELRREAGPAVAGQGGTFGPATVQARLGDGLALTNADLVEHTFTFTGVCQRGPVTVGPGETLAALLLDVPGSCRVATDEPGGAQVATLNVAAPT
ncbi:MAG TPA: hypothetical protein VHI93_01150, partial [Candidatus Thermoplasmatota archaeon]|nr:hypothetical protein [Candidatus Thermoplasmatota archaeon]